MGELRNHFNDEALGNGYIDKVVNGGFLKKVDEIGYLLNRMMRNVRKARDLHNMNKKLRQSSSRRLPGLPKLLSEGGTSIQAVNHVSKKTRKTK